MLGFGVLLTALACQAFPQSPAERLLRAAAIASTVAVFAITVTVNVPINQVVADERAGRRRTDAQLLALRERWLVGHRVRTAASVAGLALFLTASVV
jgi:uncharacterized membrane protein